MAAVPIAFYAPMKSPDHPAPSGDRTMARLLIRALHEAGFDPTAASRLRTWEGVGDRAVQEGIRDASLAEADRLVAAWRARPEAARPRLFFTYHVYYKAPDWIGPRVADALGIPYAIAEGTRAGKRARGAWTIGHAGAEAALDRADVVFAVTEADREALDRGRRPGQRILDLPPFVDLHALGATTPPRFGAATGGPVRLLTVAMMRAGDKLASYRLLAQALTSLRGEPWILTIVGDGEARPEVEALFAPFGTRIIFRRSLENSADLAQAYFAADLFVWPAVNEAYGMALLEAQAFGCPVVAGAFGGVGSVVQAGNTGVLTAPGDAPDFARAVAGLLRDPPRRRMLGQAARLFVLEERSLPGAASRLRRTLAALVAEPACG
jgi:glycosyltransferase involved in cell wall biosynthesis